MEEVTVPGGLRIEPDWHFEASKRFAIGPAAYYTVGAPTLCIVAPTIITPPSGLRDLAI